MYLFKNKTSVLQCICLKTKIILNISFPLKEMNIFILINIVLCFLLALVIWMIIGYLWCSFRKFFHKTYSFFDASFIMAYFLEQLALILLIFNVPSYTSIWAGMFALIVITTASFQKLMWESRLRRISETTTDQKLIIEQVSELNEILVKENKKLKKSTENMKELVESEK